VSRESQLNAFIAHPQYKGKKKLLKLTQSSILSSFLHDCMEEGQHIDERSECAMRAFFQFFLFDLAVA